MNSWSIWAFHALDLMLRTFQVLVFLLVTLTVQFAVPGLFQRPLHQLEDRSYVLRLYHRRLLKKCGRLA